MDTKMNLPEDVQYIISKLLSAGFEAFVVGGAVRDFLLGDIPGDHDITTSATPSEIKDVFKNEKTVDTGIKHGTVSIILNKKPYEVTTYRIDGEYLDARHPESVSFTRNIKEDLARRDFTINAMAYNETSGFVDLFSGKADLNLGVIRAVGIAEKRFDEDALRILRALRFASKLDFKIEKETSLAIFKKAHLLSKVAKERIYAEWIKLLMGRGAYRIIDEYRKIIGIFIPELDEFALPAAENFLNSTYDLRFVSLFADKGASLWLSAIDTLRADNKMKALGKTLLENLETPINDEYEIKLVLSKIGIENTAKLVEFKNLCGKASGKEKALFEKVVKNGDCFRLSEMKISGKELAKIGICGKKTGDVLLKTLDSVMRGETPNEREALLDYAVKLK